MFLMHNTQIFTVQFGMFVRFDRSLLEWNCGILSLLLSLSPSVSFWLFVRLIDCGEKIHLQLSQLLSYFHLVALFHKYFQVHTVYTRMCLSMCSRFFSVSVYVCVHTQQLK